MKRGTSAQDDWPTGVHAPADRASTATMSRSMTNSAGAEHESTGTPPGFYFGTDAAGFDHYYQSGTRRMTVTDGDESRTFKIPHDKDLVDWAIQTVEEHEGPWEEVRLHPPKCHWLTGDVPVGEFVDSAGDS